MAMYNSPQPTAALRTLRPESIETITVVDETEDDGEYVEVEIDGEEPTPSDMPEDAASHDANLAEFMSPTDRKKIGAEIIEYYDAALRSRQEWEKAYIEGLDLLGLKKEERTRPWKGASGVHHPMLMEACVRFQSQAMSATFPAAGPWRSQMVGKHDTAKRKQAKRVVQEMNYLSVEKMEDYRDEHERLLFRLALNGSCFKKVYFDEEDGYPAAPMIPADDLVVPYGETSLKRADSFEVQRVDDNIVKRRIADGMYFYEGELPSPKPDVDRTKEKEAKLSGVQQDITSDNRHFLIEAHVSYMMPDPFSEGLSYALPYVITVHKDTGEVFAIRRNWREGDTKKRKIVHYIHYIYFPGLGFYGLGLIHLMGGLTRSATSIMRQLNDAGSLSNLPAGFKTKGLRIKGDSSPLAPGELRDIDISAGSLKDNIHWMPAKEPSGVLHALLGSIIEEGRRIGSVSDAETGTMDANAAVGTVLALLERSFKVMSAVQARVHAAMRKEGRMLAQIIHDWMPPEYEYETDDPDADRKRDFDGRVDILPVTDPNAATMAMQVVRHEAAIRLAEQAPDVYDRPLLHRQALEALEIRDAEKIVKLEDDFVPRDPVYENMAIIKGEPVKAFLDQDHEAHIRVHMAAMQDPKLMELVGQSPMANAIMAAAQAHIQEHVAYQYRREIEKTLGVPLHDPDTELPPEVEQRMSGMIADAADRILAKNQQEAQQAEAQKTAEDPVYQLQVREMDLKEAEFEHKREMDLRNYEVKIEDIRIKDENEDERIKSNERIAGARIGLDAAARFAERQSREQSEGVRLGIDVASRIDSMFDKDRQEGSRGRTGS